MGLSLKSLIFPLALILTSGNVKSICNHGKHIYYYFLLTFVGQGSSNQFQIANTSRWRMLHGSPKHRKQYKVTCKREAQISSKSWNAKLFKICCGLELKRFYCKALSDTLYNTYHPCIVMTFGTPANI